MNRPKIKPAEYAKLLLGRQASLPSDPETFLAATSPLHPNNPARLQSLRSPKNLLKGRKFGSNYKMQSVPESIPTPPSSESFLNE